MVNYTHSESICGLRTTAETWYTLHSETIRLLRGEGRVWILKKIIIISGLAGIQTKTETIAETRLQDLNWSSCYVIPSIPKFPKLIPGHKVGMQEPRYSNE